MTKADVAQLEKKMEERLAAAETKINQKLNELTTQMQQLGSENSSITTQLQHLGAENTVLNKKLDSQFQELMKTLHTLQPPSATPTPESSDAANNKEQPKKGIIITKKATTTPTVVDVTSATSPQSQKAMTNTSVIVKVAASLPVTKGCVSQPHTQDSACLTFFSMAKVAEHQLHFPVATSRRRVAPSSSPTFPILIWPTVSTSPGGRPSPEPPPPLHQRARPSPTSPTRSTSKLFHGASSRYTRDGLFLDLGLMGLFEARARIMDLHTNTTGGTPSFSCTSPTKSFGQKIFIWRLGTTLSVLFLIHNFFIRLTSNVKIKDLHGIGLMRASNIFPRLEDKSRFQGDGGPRGRMWDIIWKKKVLGWRRHPTQGATTGCEEPREVKAKHWSSSQEPTLRTRLFFKGAVLLDPRLVDNSKGVSWVVKVVVVGCYISAREVMLVVIIVEVVIKLLGFSLLSPHVLEAYK